MDIHEQHSAYLEKCCDAYQVLCETYDWLRISCMADGRLRSADDISKEVLDAVLSRFGELLTGFLLILFMGLL